MDRNRNSDQRQQNERAGERAGAGGNANQREGMRREGEQQSGAARRVEQAKAQNTPDEPGGYKRVDARPADEQREVEKAIAEDHKERQRKLDEQKQADQADQNAKSAQKPISEDGKSSHPSQTGQSAQPKTITGLSPAEQRREIEAGEQQTGRGVSSLNQGPSDTVSPDPHNPANYQAVRGGDSGVAGPQDTGGTGQAPPTGPRPGTTEATKEKPSM